MKKQYRLINLGCANCAAKMEQQIARLPGVQSAAVNFMAAKLTVEADEDRFPDLKAELAAIVRRIEPDCQLR